MKILPPPTPNRKEYPFVGRVFFQGIPINIENLKGSYRTGIDRGGNHWSRKMYAHYGEIGVDSGDDRPRTKTARKWSTIAPDGDRVDVYVMSHENAPNAYIVDQRDPETGEFDEQKIILGARDKEEAKRLYFRQYDEPEKYFMGIREMPVSRLKRLLTAKENVGMIKGMTELLKGVAKQAPERWITVGEGEDARHLPIRDGKIMGGAPPPRHIAEKIHATTKDPEKKAKWAKHLYGKHGHPKDVFKPDPDNEWKYYGTRITVKDFDGTEHSATVHRVLPSFGGGAVIEARPDWYDERGIDEYADVRVSLESIARVDDVKIAEKDQKKEEEPRKQETKTVGEMAKVEKPKRKKREDTPEAKNDVLKQLEEEALRPAPWASVQLKRGTAENILDGSKKVKVSGWVDNSGNFILHKKGNKWVLSHVPTGTYIKNDLANLDEGKAILHAMKNKTKVDWSKDGSDLADEPELRKTQDVIEEARSDVLRRKNLASMWIDEAYRMHVPGDIRKLFQGAKDKDKLSLLARHSNIEYPEHVAKKHAETLSMEGVIPNHVIEAVKSVEVEKPKSYMREVVKHGDAKKVAKSLMRYIDMDVAHDGMRGMFVDHKRGMAYGTDGRRLRIVPIDTEKIKAGRYDKKGTWLDNTSGVDYDAVVPTKVKTKVPIDVGSMKKLLDPAKNLAVVGFEKKGRNVYFVPNIRAKDIDKVRIKIGESKSRGDFKIGVNPKYLRDSMDKKGTAILGVNGELVPIKVEHEDGTTDLIMPMRVGE